MSYFETWNKNINNTDDQEQYSAYIQHYYDLEKAAYDKILAAYPDNQSLIQGKASDLAVLLGFRAEDMEIFVGFVDGILPSLLSPVELETITDETMISLSIDYEKLYWNMRDAKADWLYDLPSWNNVLPIEKRTEITKSFRESKIAHVEKIGRNDRCPCGSGKKYKQCCMDKA
jgi:hypothetical protein